MKRVRTILCMVLALVIAVSAVSPYALGCSRFTRKAHTYSVPAELQTELEKIYKRYNFSIGWGLYDISGSSLKEVASYHVDNSFQSNCTIKAVMLMYICQLMDAGKLSLSTKMKVDLSKLHYQKFGSSGSYTVEYLLKRMIHVSNNVCYEVFLRYVGRETFNEYLKNLGSSTVIQSYNYMGNCRPCDRATEWFAIYNYCHSRAKHSAHAWNLLCEAKFSPIRDGIGRPAAHKSGWYYKKGTCGTAGDCAVVQTDNGGCYLMIVFTHNNEHGNYSEKLIREIAVTLDKVWDDYYLSMPRIRRKTTAFTT